MRHLAIAFTLLLFAGPAWSQGQPLASPIYYLSTAPALVDGEPVGGALTPSSGRNFKDGSYVDVLVLRGSAGETVEIVVESDDFDTFLSLFAPDGTLVDTNDDDWGGSDAYFTSRLRVELPVTGTYVVVVSGYGAFDLGSYVVTRTAYVPPPQVIVDVPGPGRYTGFLEEDAADVYRLNLDAPATVVATLRSLDFDTFLEAYGGLGDWIDANDDFDGTDSQLVLELPAGAFEWIVSAYFAGSSGSYTLVLEY